MVRLRDPVSGVILHFVPGGAVEAGEQPAAAATREALEETGLVVEVDEASELVARYPFRWAGQDYDTTTHFFRARVSEGSTLPDVAPIGQPAAYQLGALWVPLEDAEAFLSFHPVIWRSTLSLF